MGHNGSKTSSSDKFLNAMNLEYAVISVEKNNDYGHSNKEIFGEMSIRGIKLYRTDEFGVIIATCDGNNITFNATS